MPIDIRAEVSCSLGTVISGSFADDYLQGNGLIKTRGEVVLSGTQTPVVGTSVTFTYDKAGSSYTVPRVLRVLSSFADPFRRTTTVQLGCKLTYLENRKPPVENPNSKDENDVPCAVFLKATLPITAKYVFEECLNALALVSDTVPLSNKFSVEEFDLGPGFIQVMSDLLQSEGFVGYLDSTERLKFLDLTDDAGSGPVITPDEVVDLGPIGSGDLPGESVVVRWSNLRLLPPDELYGDDYLKRSWEIEEVFGAPSEVSVSYTTDEGTTVSDSDVFYPYTFSATRYDVWDRKIESISLNLVSSAEVNNRWSSDAFKKGSSWNQPTARMVREVVEYQTAAAAANSVNLLSVQNIGSGPSTIKGALGASAESHTGAANLCKEEPPAGAEVVKSQTTYSYFSELELAGSLNIDSYISDGGTLEGFDTVALELDSTVVVEYETDEASGISKTITKRWVSRSQTVSGQQDLATKAQEIDAADLSNSINALLSLARRQVYLGAETSLHTQREYGLQKRPSEKDRNNTANSKPQISESKAAITWVTGSTTSTAVTEFTLPYAPDDEISWQEGVGFSSKPSDAKQKAMRYGRIQNALLLGNRSGVSLQLAPEQLPKRPFDSLYLQAGGITGSYRVNGTSWAFDANGIVASTDALLWGAVSAAAGTNLASSWVPLAPGTTSLPLPYTPTTGGLDSETGVTYSAVISPTTVLPPYLESVAVEGISRSSVALLDYPYTLDRGTSTQVVVTKTRAQVTQVQGTVVVLSVKAQLGDVQVTYPGAENITRTLTTQTSITPQVVKYEAPLAVFGHVNTPFITFMRIYEGTVQKLSNPASLPSVRCSDVAVSPDGNLVAFMQTSSPWLGLYTNSNYTFTKQTAPAVQPDGDGQLAFSPGGGYLFTKQTYTSPYYKLYRVAGSTVEAVAGGLDVVPTSGIQGFAFSPDDALLAVTYGSVLRVYRRQGDAFVSVTSVTLPAAGGQLTWAPDLAYIAVGIGAAPRVALYSFNGSTLTAVTGAISAPASTTDLAFSPVGSYLAISHSAAPFLTFYKRSGSTFTALTTGIPSSSGSAFVRSIGWTGYGDYFVIHTSTPAVRMWKVTPATDSFVERTAIPTIAGDVYANNSMALLPWPVPVRTPAQGATTTMAVSIEPSVVSFDPNDPLAFLTTNALPRLGVASATSTTGWTSLYSGNADDAFTSQVTLPFAVTISNTSSSAAFISSNSFLTFGEGSDSYSPDATFPELLKLLVGAADYSYQAVYTKAGSGYVILRYEGFDNYSGTTVGNSNIIWEVALLAPHPTTGAQVIELRIGSHAGYLENGILLCDITAEVTSAVPATALTSYIFQGNATGTSWTVTANASLVSV